MKFLIALIGLVAVSSQSYLDKPNPKWSRKPRRALRSDEVEVPIVSVFQVARDRESYVVRLEFFL